MHTSSASFARSLGAGVATLVLSSFILAQGSQTAGADEIIVRAAPGTVLKGFETSRATMQDLALPRTSVAGLEIRVSLGGKIYELVLRAHDVRGPNFKLVVSDDKGTHVVPTPPNTTYRGVVSGYGDSVIAASIVDGQMTALIQFHKNEAPWSVQPLTDVIKGAPRLTHVMHNGKDSTVANQKCGNTEISAQPIPNGNPGTPSGTVYECDIACDADYEEYLGHGSNVTTTQNDVTSVINACTVIYKRDVDIEYKITQIIVRTKRVYASTLNYSTLLSAYRSYWITNHTSVKRDVSHLFTRKKRVNGVIGVAFLSSICSTNIGYGLSYTHYTSNFTNRVGLTAHELGHSFGSGHCSGTSNCFIMCPSLGGCGRNVTKFGTGSIGSIVKFRNSRTCLTKRTGNGPIVNTITPGTVNAFRGGTITVAGLKFTGATKVRVGSLILTPGTNPKTQFKLLSDTKIQFESPTPNNLLPMQVTVETAKGVSPAKSYGFKETEPPLLEATASPSRGGLMLWEFGAGVFDTYFLTVSVNSGTFNFMGETWMNQAVILAGGNTNFAGYASLIVSPVPTSTTLGLQFYSQVVTLNKFPAAFDGNTNITTSKVK